MEEGGGVGTIVWVRRRNGSWWPGKILGGEQLSASHLMSPRSGTPVKLLGREDASVDWYNLDKSKRVKPFRCGEFDDCIERAQASQGLPPKKREKYARREDAILHALELEKQLLHPNGNNGLTTNVLEKDLYPEFSFYNGKYVDPYNDDNKRKGRVDSGRQLDGDDISPDIPPRFRGLQDLGVAPIPLKYRLSSSLATSNGSHKHDGVSAAGLSPENMMMMMMPVGGKHLLDKRKRSREGNMEESVSKRRDRRRPIVQVLKSSHPLQLQSHDPAVLIKSEVGEDKREVIVNPAMVGNHHPAMAVKSGDSFDNRDQVESNILVSSGKNLLEKRKRSLERHMEESFGERSDKHQVVGSREQSPIVNSLHLQGDDSAFPLILDKGQREVVDHHVNHMALVKSDYSFVYDETLSDWVESSTPKSERINNAFRFGSSEENTTEEEDTETDSSETESLNSDTYDAMATLSDDADHIEFIPKVFGRSEAGGEDEIMSDADDSDESLPTSATVSKWQLKGKRNTRSLMKRYQNAAAGDNKLLVGSSSQWMTYRGEDNGAYLYDKSIISQEIGYNNIPGRDIGGRLLDSSHGIIDPLEGYWEQQPLEYHDSLLPLYHQYGGRMLIDVDVQVQSGYQRQHVPMISLMSKLNDKAIVGHPIPVETLQDGSSDIILLSAASPHEFQTESLAVVGHDDTKTLQPWRTARRTAKSRVPWPPTQDDEYTAADEERKHHRRGRGISRKWPSSKLQKKPEKRSLLFYSQKVRTLSSIGGGEKQTSSDLRGADEGLMKPPAAAAVACIPVKLVFSRLHEELVVRHQ